MINSTSLKNFDSDFVQVDVSRFPLIHVEMLEKKPTAEQMDNYIEYYAALHSQPTPFVILMEFPKKMVFMNAEERIKFGKWLKANKDKMETCKATAFVMTNPLYNVLMKGIFIIQNPISEYVVVNTKEKAEEWLNSKVKEKGIS